MDILSKYSRNYIKEELLVKRQFTLYFIKVNTFLVV